MTSKSFFFAGGGTGGHIYPAIAVAEKILQADPNAKVHFFCSSRDIDTHIFSKTNFEYTPLPAVGFSLRPDKAVAFGRAFLASAKMVREKIAQSDNPIVIGVGGFVAAPVCFAAHRLNAAIMLLNVDIVPGRANKLLARWAQQIFVQFEKTAPYFSDHKAKINIVGCPLRSCFDNSSSNVIEKLGLDTNKKTLLITGASSGAANINEAVCSLLDRLSVFADRWQIIHLAGLANFHAVRQKYAGAKISYKVLDYYDALPDILSAADLVVGRSGAVSVAEYATAQLPSICMPYPYHKDRHQYLNAGWLVEAGAAIIVDDLPNAKERADFLAQELEALMSDNDKRLRMREACKKIAKKDAATKIAQTLMNDDL
ncbi:MAG: UDP-N-acetylglucosamine--N-acetylmuramyl-(pentapeptide) pyrophosphoryl-undecaprenol N-acetylglucosamine transferase [Planctomycetota bacterium]|jgi:UDP-N-acetylglucosamine--N-acetylmuramyl-(pentapeptide) pyrophosphoryl-undecaprenol N-acetylglucosamine transferase